MADPPPDASPSGRLDDRGVLVSDRYGDVYFADDRHGDPVATGLAQAECVFVDGNGLRARWADAGPGPFVIGETGFGSGLTFLAAWRAFRAAAPGHTTLHYWSVERHPLAPSLQRRIAERADPERGGELAAHYEQALAMQDRGAVRMPLDGGRVQLTLVLDGATAALAAHTFWADAWFLDGFAPARNPEMWSDELLALVGQRSRAGTTAATWCAAGQVRRGLERAGFDVERLPGFAGKRHRIAATLRRPPAPTPTSTLAPWQLRPRGWRGPRRARVLGAGIAGATVARALAERGFAVRIEAPPAAAATLPTAVVQPRFAPPDAFGPAWATEGFRFASRFYRALGDLRPGSVLPCGVFHPALDERERREQQARLAAADPPPELGRWIEGPALDGPSHEGTALRGMELGDTELEGLGLPPGLAPIGGTWMPRALVVRPEAVCEALLDHPAIERVAAPAAAGDERAGAAAESVGLTILATGIAARERPECAWLDLRPVRGQISSIDAGAEPRCVLAGGGHVTPTIAGVRWIGATYGRGDASLERRAEDDAANLARLARFAPGDRARCRGAWVGVRASTADSVPIVGPLPDPRAFEAQHGAQLRGARVPASAHPELPATLVSLGHGSRGFATTPLTSLLLADLVEGTPLPVADALAWRLWPGRVLAREIARR